jgi:hypothetical protein
MLVLQRSACCCGPRRSGGNRLIHVGCEGFRDQHSTAELATLLLAVGCKEPASAARLSTQIRCAVLRFGSRLESTSA